MGVYWGSVSGPYLVISGYEGSDLDPLSICEVSIWDISGYPRSRFKTSRIYEVSIWDISGSARSEMMSFGVYPVCQGLARPSATPRNTSCHHP